MDKQPKRLIEQLQNIHLRQRRAIHQLQAENARLLSDLADVRQERDGYRGKVALARRENVELQNKLEEALTQYQDLKRGRTTLVRFVASADDTRPCSANPGSKTLNILSVVDEGQTESPEPPRTTTTDMEKVAHSKLRPYQHKELPKPPKPRPSYPVSIVSQPAMI